MCRTSAVGDQLARHDQRLDEAIEIGGRATENAAPARILDAPSFAR